VTRKKAKTLSPEQIQEIARRVRNGEQQTALAIEYGVVQSTISHILRRKHRVGLVLVGANRECSECGSPFLPSRAKQVVCGDKGSPCYVERLRRMNADRVALANRRQMNQKIQLIRTHKDKPCHDCGRAYPHYVMDLDHRDPSTKNPKLKLQGTKHRSMTGLTKAQLIAELPKCDVVCANCHRERTHQGMKSGLIRFNEAGKAKSKRTWARKRARKGQAELAFLGGSHHAA
jgi:ribosomal protein L22